MAQLVGPDVEKEAEIKSTFYLGEKTNEARLSAVADWLDRVVRGCRGWRLPGTAPLLWAWPLVTAACDCGRLAPLSKRQGEAGLRDLVAHGVQAARMGRQQVSGQREASDSRRHETGRSATS